MPGTVHRIWCEWDIGHEGVVYSTHDKAKEAAKTMYEDQDFEEPFDEVWNDYIGVEPLDFE